MIRLSNDVTEVVLDASTGVPTIVHWGARLGESGDLDSTRSALAVPIVHAALDVVAPLSIVPEHGAGFSGRPGLRGRRGGGRGWSPRFAPVSAAVCDDGDGEAAVVEAVDDVAELTLTTRIALGHTLSIGVTVTNTGSRRYSLDALTVTLPIVDRADEVLTFDGRWSREFHERRRPWPNGSFTSENRRGRTSHEAPPLVYVGPTGFGEWSGEVWGVHVAWSGNHSILLDRLSDGRRYLQAGELLHPGEVVLEPGESYTTPTVHAVYSSSGLTAASQCFHRWVRSLDVHPSTARPVTLNTWEAVYFDHDADVLRRLADAAAEIGIERFVLDDGWFGSRRSDAQGLGDWWVSADVYPEGLGPLIDHVTGLGMQFGIWVEPEMINPDSDLYREHPDWALVTQGYDAALGRQQLVLDLGHPDAYDFIHRSLDALLRDHDVSYVKWDMNRDHAQGSGRHGAAGTHTQTLALYRLIDSLRAGHPDVEFESCASGGGRIDLEILRRTERVWTSDCNDALERQRIQRGASMLIPPEVMGAHIGPTTSHTTGRTHRLAFRAATAFFGHLGVEWNVSTLTGAERAALASVIELHKQHRSLLHSGDVVRFDTDEHAMAHGVYAPDRSTAIVSYARLTTGESLTPPVVRLPGLDPEARYRIEPISLPGELPGPARVPVAWLADGLELTGRQLAVHGVRPPSIHPECARLFLLTRI